MDTLETVKNFLFENALIILPLIYELAIRLSKTEKNKSLIDLIFKIINAIIPNRNKMGGTHKLLLLLFLLPLVGSAQNDATVKGLYSTNVTDTTRIQNNRTTLQTNNGNSGGIYFDKIRNKWRVWDGTQWTNLLGGSSITASNGLTKIGNDIRLGGTLSQNTSINQNGFNTTFSGIGKITFSPTAGLAGVNIGSLAGDPTVIAAGDLWYNSTSQNIRARINGNTYTIIPALSIANGRIPYFETAGAHAYLTSETGFAYNSVSNLLNVDRIGLITNANNAGLNIGTFAGNPVTLNDGDIFINSALGHIYSRIGGVSYQLDQQSTVPAGANTQVQINNSGVFGAFPDFNYVNATKTLSASNLTLGLVSDAPGSQAIIQATSSDPTTNQIRIKGIAGVQIQGNISNGKTFLFKDSDITFPSLTTSSINTVADLTVTGLSNKITSNNSSGTNSGNITIITGNALTGNTSSGNITIDTGTPSGTGIKGSIFIQNVTASLDFPSITSGTSADLTITYAGSSVGDIVLLGTANSSVSDLTLIFTAWVSASNTVTVRCAHIGTGAAVDPPAGTFKVSVFK